MVQAITEHGIQIGNSVGKGCRAAHLRLHAGLYAKEPVLLPVMLIAMRSLEMHWMHLRQHFSLVDVAPQYKVLLCSTLVRT